MTFQLVQSLDDRQELLQRFNEARRQLHDRVQGTEFQLKSDQTKLQKLLNPTLKTLSQPIKDIGQSLTDNIQAQTTALSTQLNTVQKSIGEIKAQPLLIDNTPVFGNDHMDNVLMVFLDITRQLEVSIIEFLDSSIEKKEIKNYDGYVLYFKQINKEFEHKDYVETFDYILNLNLKDVANNTIIKNLYDSDGPLGSISLIKMLIESSTELDVTPDELLHFVYIFYSKDTKKRPANVLSFWLLSQIINGVVEKGAQSREKTEQFRAFMTRLINSPTVWDKVVTVLYNNTQASLNLMIPLITAIYQNAKLTKQDPIQFFLSFGNQKELLYRNTIKILDSVKNRTQNEAQKKTDIHFDTINDELIRMFGPNPLFIKKSDFEENKLTILDDDDNIVYKNDDPSEGLLYLLILPANELESVKGLIQNKDYHDWGKIYKLSKNDTESGTSLLAKKIRFVIDNIKIPSIPIPPVVPPLAPPPDKRGPGRPKKSSDPTPAPKTPSKGTTTTAKPTTPSTDSKLKATWNMIGVTDTDKTVGFGLGLKIDNEGNFGVLHIDIPKLKTLRLVVKKRNKKIMDRAIDNDLFELLTKRHNPKRKYNENSIQLFNKLVQMGEIPITQTGSGKKNLTGGSCDCEIESKSNNRSIQYYKNYDQLIQRLTILLGGIQSGNNDKAIKNEAMEILDVLKDNNIITPSEFSSLVNKIK